MVKQFPALKIMTEQGELVRGLGVRLALAREEPGVGASAELQLGEDVKFFPSDAALATWMAQAGTGRATIVYE
jgi:DNA polymerase-3 subunit alpha